MIDSIEILPLPRGFLYGPDNYIAAVNFIEKDFLTPVPYTRIKYYEGYATGEATIVSELGVKVMFDADYDLPYGYYKPEELEVIEDGTRTKS